MILEMRTYAVKTRAMALTEERVAQGLPERTRLSPLGACWRTEVGPLNRLICIWPYDDMAHRARVLTDAAKDVLSQTTSGLLFIEELAQLTQNQQRHLSFHLARGERGRVKIVSFTSVDPRVLEEERGFDPVLLARLSELSLVLPPLREFAEDIPEIAAQMLNQHFASQTPIENGDCFRAHGPP